MIWKDLKVWDKAHHLVIEVYKITTSFPKDELYGLTSQLKRSTISIPANIVEGHSKNTTKEYIQFLYNSRGSLEETRYYLLLAKTLNFLDNGSYEKLELDCEEISKMLNALIGSLKRKLK
jgi:four helix bundle protein